MDTNYALAKELRMKKICRFCLTQDHLLLKNIYARDERFKATAPLPLQIMAIASIEVYSNDGMPNFVCNDCRIHFEYCYRFKQMCKKAENHLRQFTLVGKWPAPLPKPKLPVLGSQQPRKPNIINQEILIPMQPAEKKPVKNMNENIDFNIIPTPIIITQSTIRPSSPSPSPSIRNTSFQRTIPNGPKKILNSNPSETPEPPVPKRIKLESEVIETIQIDDLETTPGNSKQATQGKKQTNTSAAGSNATAAFVLDKVGNNDVITIDDVQLLIQAAENDILFIDDDSSPLKSSENKGNNVSTPAPAPTPSTTPKPKLLNKASKRILNKDVNLSYEPILTKPQVKRDEDGNVEIVTEILDPNSQGQDGPDPFKNAPLVHTDVFPCPICIRSYPLKELLDIHMQKHNRERPHLCNECGKAFFTKYDLQKHTVIHSGVKPFKCQICDKAFNRAALLARHEKTHPDVAKQICVYCEKSFISKDALEKHTAIHLKHRPFECKICKKSFAFKQGLERHEVLHMKTLPFPCSYCEMSFVTPGKLARHLTAHAGKRAFPCKYCSKSFILSHHLHRHLKSHPEFYSEFLCGECKCVFKTREQFLDHCASHAKNSLICPLCREHLFVQDNIAPHFAEHAKESHACEFCDLMFTSNVKLIEHLYSEHPTSEPTFNLSDGEKASRKNKRFSGDGQQDSAENADQNNYEDMEDIVGVLDEVLDDDEPIESDSDKVEFSETIKIEPLTAEEEAEQAEFLMNYEAANRAHQQIEIREQNEKSSSSTSTSTTIQETNKQKDKALERHPKTGSIFKQTTIRSKSPAGSSTQQRRSNVTRTIGSNEKSQPVITQVITNPPRIVPMRRTTTPPIIKKIQQQQQQQKQAQKQQQQQKQAVSPPRILRGSSSTSPQSGVSAVKVLRNEKVVSSVPGPKSQRTLTKQYLDDMLKKGQTVRVSKTNAK